MSKEDKPRDALSHPVAYCFSVSRIIVPRLGIDLSIAGMIVLAEDIASLADESVTLLGDVRRLGSLVGVEGLAIGKNDRIFSVDLEDDDGSEYVVYVAAPHAGEAIRRLFEADLSVGNDIDIVRCDMVQAPGLIVDLR